MKSNFVSKSNFYFVFLLDKIVRIIYFICSTLKISKLNKYKKNRIILLDYGHLGDALLLTPAIRVIKQEKKESEIYCVVSKKGSEALRNNPLIKDTVIVDLPWYEGKIKIVKYIKAFVELSRLIKQIEPETIINFRSTRYHIEHIAMWISGISQRVGFSHKGLGYILTHSINCEKNRLIAQQKIDLVDKWLGTNHKNISLKPDYFIANNTNKKDILKDIKLAKSKINIGINASSNHNFNWPKNNYIYLCNELLKNSKYEIYLLGSEYFINYYNSITPYLTRKVKMLAGKTTLDGLIEILKNLDLLITIDTGMRHMANAVNTPVIALKHGANSVHELDKYVKYEEVMFYDVPCSPCGKEKCPINTLDCMTGIKPELVLAKARKILLYEK